MTSEFFDPAPGQADIVLIKAATLHEAEKMIESCEHCNPDATVPFDWILHRMTAFDSRIMLSILLEFSLLRPEFEADYILEEPAKCPNCKREVLENMLIEPVWFRDFLKLADQGDPKPR